MLKAFNKTEQILLFISGFIVLISGYFLYDDSLLHQTLTSTTPLIGEIEIIENDVRHKNVQNFAWNTIRNKRSLHQGDSLFTGVNSQAQVRLIDGSTLPIEENSLIVFNQSGSQLELTFKMGQAPKTAPKAIKYVQKNVRKKIASAPTSLAKLLQPAKIERMKKLSLETPTSHYPDRVISLPKITKTPPSDLAPPDLDQLSSPIHTPDLSSPKPAAPIAQTQEKLKVPVLKRKSFKYYLPSSAPLSLQWEEVRHAKEYIVEVDTSKDFKNPEYHFAKSNSFSLSLENNGKYYVRVVAVNESTRSLPSEEGKIEVTTTSPVLLKTENKIYEAKNADDLGAPGTFELKWSPIPHAANYIVEINGAKNQTHSSTYNFTAEQFKKYNWRVQALDSSKKPVTAFSSPSEFSYSYHLNLPTPQLIEPENEFTLFFQKKNAISFWLEWSPVETIKIYHLEIAQDEQFQQKIASQQTTNHRYLVNQILPPGQLYWRVRGETRGQFSDWSEVRKISIVSGRLSSESVLEGE